MAENNTTIPAQRRKKTPESTPVPIVDIIFLTLRKWPWILLSLIVCVCAAMAYILRTPDVYTRATEIMIKEPSKGKSAGMEEFADLGLISSTTSSVTCPQQHTTPSKATLWKPPHTAGSTGIEWFRCLRLWMARLTQTTTVTKTILC